MKLEFTFPELVSIADRVLNMLTTVKQAW
jgi:hypothetical protein